MPENRSIRRDPGSGLTFRAAICAVLLSVRVEWTGQAGGIGEISVILCNLRHGILSIADRYVNMIASIIKFCFVRPSGYGATGFGNGHVSDESL
jgi:hypothetical protein